MQLNWRPLTCTDSGSGIVIPFQLTSPKLEAVDHASHAMMSFPGSWTGTLTCFSRGCRTWLKPAPCRPCFSTTDWFRTRAALATGRRGRSHHPNEEAVTGQQSCCLVRVAGRVDLSQFYAPKSRVNMSVLVDQG